MATLADLQYRVLITGLSMWTSVSVALYHTRAADALHTAQQYCALSPCLQKIISQFPPLPLNAPMLQCLKTMQRFDAF